jgi:hypothetical protein
VVLDVGGSSEVCVKVKEGGAGAGATVLQYYSTTVRCPAACYMLCS